MHISHLHMLRNFAGGTKDAFVNFRRGNEKLEIIIQLESVELTLIICRESDNWTFSCSLSRLVHSHFPSVTII